MSRIHLKVRMGRMVPRRLSPPPLSSPPPQRSLTVDERALGFDMKALPPESRAVVASARFMVAPADAALSENAAEDDAPSSIWRPVTLVVTTDGTLQMFKEESIRDSGSSVGLDMVQPLARSVPLSQMKVRVSMLPGRPDALEVVIRTSAMASVTSGVAGLMRSSALESWESASKLVIYLSPEEAGDRDSNSVFPFVEIGGRHSLSPSSASTISQSQSSRAGRGWMTALHTSAVLAALEAEELVEGDAGGEDKGDGEKVLDALAWIRILHHPLADPSVAPPGSEQ